MVNRETCSVKGVFGFLERQLLTVRLHNPWWWAVVGHGVATTAALGLSCLLGTVAAATANWSRRGLDRHRAGRLLGVDGLADSSLGVVCAAHRPGATVKRSRDLALAGWLRIALAIPLAQVVHFAALAAAFFARTHRWRGVRYQFFGPLDGPRDRRPGGSGVNTNYRATSTDAGGRVREANRPGNGGFGHNVPMIAESNPWENVSLFWTGSRNAPCRWGSVLHPP